MQLYKMHLCLDCVLRQAKNKRERKRVCRKESQAKIKNNVDVDDDDDDEDNTADPILIAHFVPLLSASCIRYLTFTGILYEASIQLRFHANRIVAASVPPRQNIHGIS